MKFLALLTLIAAAQEVPKIVAPSEEAQKKAEKTIREIFKDEYASKSPAVQQQLARKLVEQARETKDDDALRYVLYREAADLAGRSGEIDTLLRSIDELYNGFQGMGLSVKEATLLKADANLTKPDDLKRLGEVLLRMLQEAIEGDQFDAAARAAQACQSSARKAKDVGLASRADAASKSVTETKAAFEKARKAEEVLAATPDDPAANQTWGEWLCFQKGRWDKGLGYLTKGPNSPVRALAVKEFNASPELESLMEVADGWWDLAERERQPLRKGQLLAHARSIYQGALPKATGLVRAKIGKRLEFDKDVPMAPSPVPSDAKRFEGHSYKLFPQGLTWADAKEFCEKQGGHLVTITSKEEGRFVAGLFKLPQENGPWIGLGYDVKAKAWKWVTGEPLKYSNWQPGEPNYLESEHAVEIFSKGAGETWNNVGGGGPHQFVCEWDR